MRGARGEGSGGSEEGGERGQRAKRGERETWYVTPKHSLREVTVFMSVPECLFLRESRVHHFKQSEEGAGVAGISRSGFLFLSI